MKAALFALAIALILFLLGECTAPRSSARPAEVYASTLEAAR